MFAAASFTIAKLWNQARCLRMDKQNVVHIHNGVLFSYKEK
jgi:hypothetical protein